ncbi:MAG: o-succinylbenzoate synthase [Ignavibacteria bacterium]|nr:o-succinylbenzoate synthase [Ignavibacteria bacterium]
MINITLKYKPYVLQLKKPFKTSKGEIKERKGFLIYLQDDEGCKGTGDCSPFPEFGSETYEAAFEVVNNLNTKFYIDVNDAYKTVELSLSQFNNLPALKHGLEQALINYICSKKNISLNEALKLSSKQFVNVNAVIGFLTTKQTKEKAARFILEGFRTIKLKVGREDFEKDFKCVKAVRNLNDNLNIRIDVNGVWSLDEAEQHLNELKQFSIEYVEQPVSNIKYFGLLKKTCSIPLAADESLRTIKDAAGIIKNKSADVLILKPMLLGGIIPMLSIYNEAIKHNLKCVVSSSLESVVGRSYALFAASLINENTAHGLGVDDYFKNDLFPNPYPVVNGKIKLG